VTRLVDERIATIPEIQSIFTVIGNIQGGARDIPESGYQYGQLALQLYRKPDVLETLNPFGNREEKALDFRKRTDTQVADDIRRLTAGIPGVQLAVFPVREFAGASAPVQVQLLGFDLNEMRRVAEKVKVMMAQIPGVIDADVSQRPGKPEIQVVVDRKKASELGMDVTDIGNALRSSYQGDNNAKYQDPQLGEQFDIRVQFPDLQRVHAADLAGIPIGKIATLSGFQSVRLNQVARTTIGEGPNKIDRKNRLREVMVSAYVLPGVVPMKINDIIEKKIAEMDLKDIKVSAGGDAEQSRTDFPFLFSSLALSFVLVYLLMAVLFDNLLHPLTIQLSLPMAVIGAVMALVWSDQMLSLVSITGFIMLGGIVQKNAILLIDYTNTLRARGMSRDEALKEAGPVRLRPILMTTLAMVFGMLPIALSIGRASEERAPLAICVIGGLIMSTILSLIVIPCIYSVFDDVQTAIARMLGKGKHSVLVEHALAEEQP
jgi:HAE1 family hydrophobic/amphiphilic exporter-1